MKTMAAGKAKARFLALLDDVKFKREPIVVTKHGKRWAQIAPLDLDESEDPLAEFRFPGKIEIHGDIVGPFYTDEEQAEFDRALMETLD